MSSPRVLRTVATNPAASSSPWNAAMASARERSKPESGNGLNGIRLNLQGRSPTRSISSRACSSESFTSRSITYSKVTKSRGEPWRCHLAAGAGTHGRASSSASGSDRRGIHVAAARGQQFLQRPLAVDRHQLVAQGVVRRVQRDGQRHRAGFAQPIHPRHETRGRQRDPAARQAVGVVVEHHPHRGDDVVEIRQRLAHAHHHHVGDGTLALREVGAQRAIGPPQLADDLARAQVAVEALPAGGAERAFERAADLARDAQRATRRFRE